MDPDSSDEMIDHLVDFFDQIAPVYDGWANGQHGRVAARLVELVKPKKGQQALDVGTGTGLVAHLLAAKVSPGSVIGIDLSDRMLSIARGKPGKHTQFLGRAAERLVVRPETFDLVTTGGALAYLAAPSDGLGEAHRDLRSGGRWTGSGQRGGLGARGEEEWARRGVGTKAGSGRGQPGAVVFAFVLPIVKPATSAASRQSPAATAKISRYSWRKAAATRRSR